MKRKEVVKYIREELDRRGSFIAWEDSSYYRNQGALDALEELLEMLIRD